MSLTNRFFDVSIWMVKYNKYVLEKIGRLDLRYYLIKVHNRYYVIDYFNPRDFRNYLLYFFPKQAYEWTIYDVTDQYQDFTSFPLFWTLFSYSDKVIAGSILIYIFGGLVIPKPYLPQMLTYSNWIIREWPLIILGVVLGYFFLIILMMLTTPNRKELNSYPSYRLEQIDKGNGKKLPFPLKILYWLFFVLFLIGSGLFIGIGGSNYFGLFAFGIAFPYSIMIPKLFGLSIPEGRSKFYVINERGEKI